MAWENPQVGAALARDGYDVVITPGQAYYLDMAQSPAWLEPGRRLGRLLDPGGDLRLRRRGELSGRAPPRFQRRAGLHLVRALPHPGLFQRPRLPPPRRRRRGRLDPARLRRTGSASRPSPARTRASEIPMLRIAVGGIHTECSTYSPVLMTAEDFRVLRGADLTAADYFAFLPRPDVTLLPLLHARAVPGGPGGRAGLCRLPRRVPRSPARLPADRRRLSRHARRHPCRRHGGRRGRLDRRRARDRGTGRPVAASYDLHGNLSQRIVDALDIFSAYRTAPHIDVRRTMEAAWTMLLLPAPPRHAAAASPGRRSRSSCPASAAPPRTSPPARSTPPSRRSTPAPASSKADLLIGYVWADEPRATAAAVVTATDRAAALDAAEEIAARFWSARDAFRFGPPTGPLPEMLDRAEAAATRRSSSRTRRQPDRRRGRRPRRRPRRTPRPRLAGCASRRHHRPARGRGLLRRRRRRHAAAGDRRQPRPLQHAGPSRRPRPPPRRRRGAPSARPWSPSRGLTLVLAARRRPYHDLADFPRLGLDPPRCACSW